MLWPETSTYAAFPPSDCGRRYCAQKRQTRTVSAMPAALFARATGACRRESLLLIVDHELRLVPGRPVLGGAEERRHIGAAARLADQPAVVGRRRLDQRIDVRGDRHALRHAARRTGRECRERRSGRRHGVPRGRAAPRALNRRDLQRLARAGSARDREVQRRRVGAARRRDVAAREVEAYEQPRALVRLRTDAQGRRAAEARGRVLLVDVGVGRRARSLQRARALGERLRARPEVAGRHGQGRGVRGAETGHERGCEQQQSEPPLPHGPTTAKLYERRLAAGTVAPKLENVSVPPPAGTGALAAPSEAPPEPTSVSESVAPAQALGTDGIETCVTFPALSTLRVALSEETPHEPTAALPAARGFEARASVAAAPHAAHAAASIRVLPSAFARSFISNQSLSDRGGRGTCRKVLRPLVVRRYAARRLAVDRDREAGDTRRVQVRGRGQCERAAADRRRARGRAERGAARAGERRRDRLAGAVRVDAGHRDARDRVARERRVVGDGVGAGRRAARLT